MIAHSLPFVNYIYDFAAIKQRFILSLFYQKEKVS